MKINHVAIYVKDLEKTKEFYEKYFEARLEIMSRPELSERNDKIMNEGFIHLAFSVGNKENVDKLTKRLVNDGFRCLSGPRTTGDGYYESVIEDCEGNLIEITEW